MLPHTLEARLAQASPAPLLAFRLPALERTAWRRGLRAARRLEQRAAHAFVASSRRALRRQDVVAHEPCSDVFLAGLLAPVRRGGSASQAADARTTALRMAAAMAAGTGLDVQAGWAVFEAGPAACLNDTVANALVRGEQERERFAFFSTVGHELRTPLCSIRGYLETVIDDDVGPQQQQRFLGIALAEARRLERLVEAMFDLSLLDLGPQKTPGGRTDLGVALHAAKDACARRAQERGIRLTIDVRQGPHVGMERERLIIALINVIENGIKHGRRGGRVHVRIAPENRRWIRLLVDDDGPGIPACDAERMFRIGERGATRAAGNGLGLALVRRILERAGGTIELHRSPLGGARFVLSLPAPANAA